MELCERIENLNDSKKVIVSKFLDIIESGGRISYDKKNVTIPSWLNIMAMENGINFSETLTEALKQKLNISNTNPQNIIINIDTKNLDKED